MLGNNEVDFSPLDEVWWNWCDEKMPEDECEQYYVVYVNKSGVPTYIGVAVSDFNGDFFLRFPPEYEREIKAFAWRPVELPEAPSYKAVAKHGLLDFIFAEKDAEIESEVDEK